MGNFFTSTQIYDPNQLDRDTFIDLFCKEMKSAGYVTCNSDEGELSYILRFGDNCKWVAITSEDYGEGDPAAQKDTGRIAKMLKTTCISTTIIDSDCAVMEMYDQSGKIADTIIMGRADDYFGDHLPKLSEQNWKPFLAEGKTWEQLNNIVQNSEGYTFIEDGLSELAPIIGMDDSNILFHADIAEEEEQTVFLNFKKDNAKKEKKLTLNAAFKQVFGELLEPLGFKLVKSKYPYYIRVVGEGIIQSVSVAKEKSIDDPNEEGFSIYVGVNLVSSPMPNFDKSPIIFDNMGWMKSLDDFHRNFLKYLDEFHKEYEDHSLFYKKGETGEMMDAMKKSRLDFMPFVLEYIEKLNTLEDIYQAGFIVEVAYHDATILLERIDKEIEKMKKELPEKIKKAESYFADNPLLLKSNKETIMWNYERRLKYYSSLKKGGEAYDDYMKTAEETKENNLELLKEYGIIDEEDMQTESLNVKKAEAKEKKLTLKAAFISVFGEALEPLGFVKIKSKHPYYVRVVNGEILNIITFEKDSKTEFGVFGGIATLYRKKFDFDHNVINNINVMNDTAQFYFYSEPYESAKSIFNRSYSFLPGDNNSISHSFLEALSHTKQYIIPVMDKIVSLRDCVDFYMVYHSPIMQILFNEKDISGANEGLLYFKIDDHSDMKHEFAKYLDCHKRFTDYDVLFKHAEEYRKKQIQKRDEVYNNNEKYEEIVAELSLRKNTNLNILRQYGLNIAD